MIFTTLLVLAFTMFTAFKSVGFSRQRTEATALANQALEQIRALPADQLFMSVADSATDTQLLPAGCVAAGNCTFNGRTVPMSNFGALPPATPLVPSHVTTQTPSPGNSVYTIKSYLTIDPLDATNQTRIATIQVSWSNPSQAGVSPNVQVESKLHTAAFNDTAPGTHTYTSSAVGSGAVVSITGSMLNRSNVQVGLNFSSTNAYLSGGVGGTNVGPTGNLVSGGSAPSTLSAAGVAQVATTSSIATAGNAAGTVTPTGPNTASSAAATLTLAGSSAILGGTGSIVVASGASNGAAVAASQANGQTSIPSGNLLPTNRLGYGRGTATQSGPVSATMDLLGLLNLGLVSITPAGNATPDVATVAETSNTYSASANKSFTQVKVLSGLLLLPPVVQLDGFTSSVSACAAAAGGSCSPATAVSTGTLKISGVTVPFIPSLITQTIAVPSISVVTLLGTVAISASVTIGAATTTSTNSATATSPVKVALHLQVATLANLDINVDLGSLTASASYT